MSSLKERVSEILIKNKVVSPEDLQTALSFQKEKGGRLSDILIQLNLVKEKELVYSLSQGLGLPPIDLSRFKIDPEVLKIISSDIARHYQIIPVSLMADTLTIAMADPLNIFAIDHIKTFTGYKINPVIASSKDILNSLDQYYGEATQVAIEEIVKDISSEKIELIREEKEDLPAAAELTRMIQDAPIVKYTNFVLEEGVKISASDILIEPLEKKMRLRFRVDGVLKEQTPPSKAMHHGIVSRIKVISDLDIAEHRLPQDGRFKAKILNREVDFRVSILPSSFGEKVALRILDKATATLDLVKLGFDKDSLGVIKKCAKRPHGMILVTGPTGSGKTTTLYSILKFVDSPEKNIVTVEDPIEYQLEGINQVSIRPEVGLTFASSLRAILRQDPNIIMVGEIRDFETVDIAIKAALTGHLVLSTVHTTTAAGGIVRLINMGVEPFLITSSLICILSQRLVRILCNNCKESYELKPDIIERMKLNIRDKNVKFFRPKGCKRCFNTGYAGRTVISEILVLTTKIKDLILERAQEHVIKAAARSEGMKTLRENGLLLANAGITSLEEIVRVTAADE
ncbi:MAG: ATPase, T2SS/T4P/T4SS family [Candidatus Omnitrophota bacterium]